MMQADAPHVLSSLYAEMWIRVARRAPASYLAKTVQVYANYCQSSNFIHFSLSADNFSEPMTFEAMVRDPLLVLRSNERALEVAGVVDILIVVLQVRLGGVFFPFFL
jgi:hypothetical protein